MQSEMLASFQAGSLDVGLIESILMGKVLEESGVPRMDPEHAGGPVPWELKTCFGTTLLVSKGRPKACKPWPDALPEVTNRILL